MEPMYPLFPVFTFVNAFLILLVLCVRRSLNLGASMLCIWIALLDVIYGVNSILWADNKDLKAFMWCDIVTHLQVFFSISKPACTLIITRRLYLATKLEVDPPSSDKRRRELLFDLGLGIAWPVICASIFYYIVQDCRFLIVEGQGCRSSVWPSGVEVLLLSIWPVVFPLISSVFYCPCILWTFYRHAREADHALSSHPSLSRPAYNRILALGFIDILIMLPIGIVSLIPNFPLPAAYGFPFVFYPGWAPIHADWAPVAVTVAELNLRSFWASWDMNFSRWANAAQGLFVFAVFGFL
ncbi:GPCR fungal pheromone mating factor [Vararia minispora EC-137]|uniref:GPCR fungal pheromone mating factor n=1 Tax=Vararia minispora EC-137 TaxID=1314806 RepID=A0ACB8QPR0_9AGAM|nr:GPCR fungal pheromone mating factor [Vararia minispora EC-137]